MNFALSYKLPVRIIRSTMFLLVLTEVLTLLRPYVNLPGASALAR